MARAGAKFDQGVGPRAYNESERSPEAARHEMRFDDPAKALEAMKGLSQDQIKSLLMQQSPEVLAAITLAMFNVG